MERLSKVVSLSVLGDLWRGNGMLSGVIWGRDVWVAV